MINNNNYKHKIKNKKTARSTKFNLKEKDAFFKETYTKAYPRNPNKDGLVPTLIHGDNIVCESDLVSWYIAESFNSGS